MISFPDRLGDKSTQARATSLIPRRQRPARDFFRSIDLHWMLRGTPLSAIGSRIRGGRYNRKGAFEAFYIANTQETALYETEAIFKFAGIVVGVRHLPRVMLSLEYNLHDIVELRESTALATLGVTIDEFKAPWKLAQAEDRPTLTQRIGAAAHAVDIEALLVPSARVDAGTNLVVSPIVCVRRAASTFSSAMSRRFRATRSKASMNRRSGLRASAPRTLRLLRRHATRGANRRYRRLQYSRERALAASVAALARSVRD